VIPWTPFEGGALEIQAAIGTSKAESSFAVAVLPAVWLFRIYAVLIVGAAGFLSVAFGPDNNWDLRFYHLYAPWAYLHGRYLYDVGPAQFQSFFNPTADFLFYALTSSILNETPRIVAFIMGAVHGINAVLILAIASHVLGPLALRERSMLTASALLMGVSGAGFVSLLGTTTNDLVNSIFVLGSLLGVLKLADQGNERAAWRGFAWSGLLAGVGVGLKYTAAVFIPGLALIALIVAVRRKTAFGPIAFGVAATLGFLAMAGHHLFTLWHAFGNPVFPLFNNIFQSPYYEPEAIRDVQFLPRDPWQLIAYPFYWARTNSELVSELPFRDVRCAIAYIAIVAGSLTLLSRRARIQRRVGGLFAETRGLGLVFIFVATSYFVWLGLGNYRYAVTFEMLTGIVTMGALIWLFENSRLRIVVAILLLTIAAAATVYPDWGHGEHPSTGISPARYGDRYVDVRVPQLPANSIVLIATRSPVAYFIPFAEPTAQYLGIENNYLELSQNNKLASEVKRIMWAQGRSKFIVSVGEFDGSKMNSLLEQFGLRLSTSPCQPIRSNLEEEEEALSLCSVITN
jgi:hypothetical protein